MATAGPNEADTFANDDSFGEFAWNLEFTELSVGFDYGGPHHSHLLIASDLGFEIPETATISAINVEVLQVTEDGNGVSDSRLRLVVDGVVQSTDFASAAAWSADSYAWVGRELTTDLPTPAQVNASTFGIALAVQGEADIAYVKGVRLTITYEDTQDSGGVAAITRDIFDDGLGEYRSITGAEASDDTHMLNAGYYLPKRPDLVESIDEGNRSMMPKWIGGGDDFSGLFLTDAQLDRYCDVVWRKWD